MESLAAKIHLDQDVFSRILSHVPDSRTIHFVLRALPKSHELFPIALRRLCELPLYLDTYDPQAATASNEVLDYLLASQEGTSTGVESLRVAESILHLVVAVEHNKYRWPPEPEREDEEEEEEETEAEEIDASEQEEGPDQEVEESEEEEVDVVAFHDRLPGLFKKTRNLRSFDYHSYPGLPLSRESVELLAACDRLHTFAVDTPIRETPWRGSQPFDDPETWDIEPFVSTLGRAVTSLDLRHVSQTMLRILVSHGDVLASYANLAHLKMDITEGVWDWNMQGSPQRGATEAYIFPSLRFPALRRFELVVADLTISDARAGPLDLVDCTLLTELSLDVRQCIYFPISKLSLFEALSPSDFSTLTHLEIKEANSTVNAERLKWRDENSEEPERPPSQGRFYAGLVQQFLSSLPSLTSLWIDEWALLPAKGEGDGWDPVYKFCSVAELWATDSASTDFPSTDKAAWRTTLGAVLSQLESLRGGFGVMDAAEVGLILSCCDPTKLREFGFTWAWKKYGRDEPISPELLTHLARFPKLTDVHILFPRPETQLSGIPDPPIDPRTLRDVAAIFACSSSICRVGIANSVLWERHPVDPTASLLVSDGSAVPNPAVPQFYHAGQMTKYDPQGEEPWVHYDNTTPLRPRRGEEIGQLRDLLKRILD
ncbi:hypothetical protein K438DRAFT_2017815 [Mycena galopus ATCC 62051]|nr:hypothetical protein K438DRAFT_2017815 [Mycena galopus ATCC 62051]